MTTPDALVRILQDLPARYPRIINQAMAALVLEVVRRVLEGTCPWMSLFLDLDTGELKPTYATPENVSRMLRLPVRNLVTRK